MKLLPKSLIAIFATVLLVQGLKANTTICYKKNWKSPSTIETTKLDGGECNGDLSLKDMLKNGWNIKDIKIERKKDGLNYSYILTDKKLVKIDNSTFMDNKYTKLNYKPISTKISNVTKENATINIGNLRIGQSAIIQHNYENSKTLIVSNAYVVKSNKTNSTLKFLPFLDIKQNAIPTSNRNPQDGDTAILNYLYDASLIIAPSQDAFTATRAKYRDNNFLHSDIFGAKLKITREPLPSKEIIQEFAIEQNLGTIFFIIGSKVYIVDAKTFAILDENTISYNFVETEMMPFYTRVEKIEKSKIEKFLNWESIKSLKFLDFLGDDKRSEEEQLLEDEIESGELAFEGELYNNYYKTILGINK